MKHALSILIALQIILLIPFILLDWSKYLCFIPTIIIAFWYLSYGLFILCCIVVVRLCKLYVKIKNK